MAIGPRRGQGEEVGSVEKGVAAAVTSKNASLSSRRVTRGVACLPRLWLLGKGVPDEIAPEGSRGVVTDEYTVGELPVSCRATRGFLPLVLPATFGVVPPLAMVGV